MVALRWPDEVCCPRWGSVRVRWMPHQKRWKCYEKHVKPQFSLKTGTIFEKSPLGLDKWLPAIWLIVNCKNGVSSYEIGRALGVTQKTAWFMGHRIRAALHAARSPSWSARSRLTRRSLAKGEEYACQPPQAEDPRPRPG